MTIELLIFYGIVFLVAFFYASVGHGGASGYLALMALYNFTPEVMKPTALLLNLFVSLVSFIQYYRQGHFQYKIFIPLALASVPLAFLGGMIHVQTSLYKQLLGIFLILASVRFAFFPNSVVKEQEKINWPVALLIGSVIGFASGLLGIGGGIILSPVLLLLHWTNQKQTAAISALFIFVNSLSGIAGQMTKGISWHSDMLWIVVIAFAGGTLGAYLGAGKFNQKLLKYILAGVLLIAAFKLLFTKA